MNAHTRSFDDMVLSAPQAPATRSVQRASTPRRRAKGNSPEYWLVFSACFTVFLAALAIERLMPVRWRKISESIGARSFLAKARAAAHRYTAIAFQG
jgi:hypothetical protein